MNEDIRAGAQSRSRVCVQNQANAPYISRQAIT